VYFTDLKALGRKAGFLLSEHNIRNQLFGGAANGFTLLDTPNFQKNTGAP
jgi:hypothetical protein